MKKKLKFIALFLLYSLSVNSQTDLTKPVTSYVNPFIGTAGGGNTFPGAMVPWGMVSVSPHNTFSSPAGYVHCEKYFYGFGHVHLSGVGCNELGSIILTASKGAIKTNPEEYKTTYSDEKASPGFYSLLLNDLNLRTETSATKRCGITKFIPQENGKINILIDAGRSLSIKGGGQIIIRSGTEVEGYNISGGFCGEGNREKIYFSAKFSQSSSGQGSWLGNRFIYDVPVEAPDSSVGCWFTFDAEKDKPFFVKTGISYVSIENARENMNTEIPLWDFDKVRNSAEQLWNENLSKIKIEDGNTENLTKFYTALYHMLIHPGVISDVNGEYPLMGRKGVGKNKEREHYSVFSLWDTYRTLHPFLTLVFPEKQSEIVKTMLDMYDESGFLPKWELAGNETFMMVGDPAACVIADTYIKGISDFDISKAFEAVIKPSLFKTGETAPPIRAGYHELLQYCYIPFEQDHNKEWWVWGTVSTALEYNLSDWTISQLAKRLGKNEIAGTFLDRSLYYKNLFDTTTLFMQPKLKNGNWLNPFNPLITEGSEEWGGSGGPGYVEGNAWNYTWFVPHDIPGLIKLFGGEKPFADKLYESFTTKQFTITNEPDIAYPYLFNYIKGMEFRAGELVQKIIKESFGTSANGLPGNDDCGAISGWLAFSMLGFYPDCPASEFYTLGIPAFDKVTIQLNDKYYRGKTFVIEKAQNDKNSKFQKKMLFNGKEITDFRISHHDLVSGGSLLFE